MVATVPTPGSLSIVSVPPWAATRSRLMLRPRPEPGDATPLWNLSNTCSNSSDSIPTPLSATSITAPRPAGRAARRNVPPSGIERNELMTRLVRTSRSRTGSTTTSPTGSPDSTVMTTPPSAARRR